MQRHTSPLMALFRIVFTCHNVIHGNEGHGFINTYIWALKAERALSLHRILVMVTAKAK